MGDRLGTPGVVDFKLFSMRAVVAATRKSESEMKTCHCNSRKSQIKKSKLILVTAFKVGMHSIFGFRFPIFGWVGLQLQMKQLH